MLELAHCSQVIQLQQQGYPALLSFPQDYDPAKPWPLVLFLHGRGEVGGEIELLAGFGPLDYQANHSLPALTLSPHIQDCQLGWRPERLLELLDYVEQHYPVDRTRIYITGLSMGGFGAINLALQQPWRFAALAAIAGGDPNRLAPWSMQLDARPFCQQLYQRLADLPIYLAHGLKDDVVPAEFSLELYQQLSGLERNASLNYCQYPQAEHAVWEEVYQSPSFWAWLLEQKNQQAIPKQVEPKQIQPKLADYLGYYGDEHEQVAIALSDDASQLELHCQTPDEQALSFSLRATDEDLFSCSIGQLRFVRKGGGMQLALTRLALLNKTA